jgi:hypothetical protein
MTFDPDWRDRATAALERYFERRSFPRLTLSLLLCLTGAVGFLISFGLLRAGVDHMWVRYPIAVVVSYAVLLGLVRAWVEVERRRFDPGAVEITDANRNEADSSRWPDSSNGSWFDWLDVPDIDLFDWDEGCLPALLGVALLALAAILLSAIAAAPTLIAEVFLDAFLVAVLYRRLRVAQREHWLGAALRKTWFVAVLAAAVLAFGGWVLEGMAPGARSIGKAIEQLRHGTTRPEDRALERE